MVTSTGFWATLHRWRTGAFLIGGLLLLVDAAWLAGNLAMDGENYLLTGQFFVGTGWTAALLGLLGIYTTLADRSRWLSRSAAVCTAVGVVTFGVMAIVAFAAIIDVLPVAYDSIGSAFIPGVLIGSVLGFVLFSVATLRTEVFGQTFGLLLLAPPMLVLSNILRFVLGNSSEIVTLGIVIADALAILAVGFYLRRQAGVASRQQSGQSVL